MPSLARARTNKATPRISIPSRRKQKYVIVMNINTMLRPSILISLCNCWFFSIVDWSLPGLFSFCIASQYLSWGICIFCVCFCFIYIIHTYIHTYIHAYIHTYTASPQIGHPPARQAYCKDSQEVRWLFPHSAMQKNTQLILILSVYIVLYGWSLSLDASCLFF